MRVKDLQAHLEKSPQAILEAKFMSNGEVFYLALVFGAFSIFALVVGYQSFAETRWLKKKKD